MKRYKVTWSEMHEITVLVSQGEDPREVASREMGERSETYKNASFEEITDLGEEEPDWMDLAHDQHEEDMLK